MMLNSCTFFLIITVLVLKGELGDTMSRCVRDDENAVSKGYIQHEVRGPIKFIRHVIIF